MILKNYIYNVINLLTGVLFPIITFPFVSRILLPENMGKVGFAQSFTNYFLVIALTGVPSYGIRELSRARTEKNSNFEMKKVFSELLAINMISSFLSFLGLYFFLGLSEKLWEIKTLIFIFSFQVFLSFFQIDHLFIALEQHKARMIRYLGIRVLSLLLIYLFIKKPEDYLIYGLLLVIPEIIARAIDLYLFKGFVLTDFKQLELKRHLRPLFTIFLYLFSVGIYLNLDASMLGFFKDNYEVGLYSSAIKMTKIVVPLLAILGTVMSPRIISAIKKNYISETFFYMDIFTDFNFFLGIPLAFLLFYLSDSFIYLFSGENYQGAVTTMRIMTPIVFTIPLTTFLGGQVLLPNNRENFVFKISFLAMLTNALLNYIFIPKYGRNGAAIATIFTENIVFIFRIFEVKKIYPDYIFITKKRIFNLIAGFISLLFILAANHFIKYNSPFSRIIFTSLLYWISYISFLFFALKNQKNIFFKFPS